MGQIKPMLKVHSSGGSPRGLSRLLPPPPLFLLQPLLKRIVHRVATRSPDLFVRLGESRLKRFLIDPSNLPFMLWLLPDPANLHLVAVSRRQPIEHDVRVTAPFLTLLTMIDGGSDGDALFFNRDLHIEGDTEAVVALRNALDDMDRTLVDEVVATFGPLSGPLRAAVDFLNRPKGTNS